MKIHVPFFGLYLRRIIGYAQMVYCQFICLLADPDFIQPALIPTPYANHGGQDVPVYAIGPMSPHVS